MAMKIKKSNGFSEEYEDLKMIHHITQDKKIKRELDDTKYLIVEGKDDVEVIKSYFEHNGFYTNNSYPFQVITPTKYQFKGDDEEFQAIKIDGKNNVLKSINNAIEHNQKDRFCCVIDRDLDFILEKNSNLENVFYYDYYELENYLLSKDVISKILLAIKYKYKKITELEDISIILGRIEELDVIFKDYAFLNILREFNYHEKISSDKMLSNDELKGIVALSGQMHASKLNYYCASLNLNDSIQKLFNTELKDCSICMDDLKERYPEIEDILTSNSISKYLVDGKRVMDMFLLAIKHVFLNSKKNDIQDFYFRLKNEWIPCHSKEFNEKIKQIENYFNIGKVQAAI